MQNRALPFLLLFMLFAFGGLWPPIVQAQDTRETLRAPIADLPPFLTIGENGEPGGFMPEVTKALSERLGVDIDFVRYDGPQQIFEAFRAGELDIFVGVATLEGLENRVLFSSTVAETNVRLYVRAEDAARYEPASMTGAQIAIIPPTAGSEPSAFLDRNVPVPLATFEETLIALLSGTVDGALVPEESLLAYAHGIGVDHRIVPVGPSLRVYRRVVALNRDRADLMPRINDTIAALEDDGTLSRLRRSYFIDVAAAPPVLTVGVPPVPPLAQYDSEGEASGLAIEILRALAMRIELPLRFVPLPELPDTMGPLPEGVDLLPFAPVLSDIPLSHDQTLPVFNGALSVFTLSGADNQPVTAADLAGRTVGLSDGWSEFVTAALGLDPDAVRVYGDREALLSALQNGEIAAAVDGEEVFARLLSETGADRNVTEALRLSGDLPFAISLRYGLGSVRERLNGAIPGFLVSDEYRAIQTTWAGTTGFWSNDRVAVAIYAGIVTVICLLGALGYTVRRRWVIAVPTALAALCLLIVPVLFVMHRQTVRDTAVAVERLPRAMLRLERAIGYSGMIHNFKNAVLRPDEQRFIRAAISNYLDATATLSEIVRLAEEIALDVDVSEIRESLDAYRGMIDRLETLNAQGLDVSEVDAAVRIPDERAARQIDTLQSALLSAASGRLDRQEAQLGIMLAVAAALVFAVPAGMGLIVALRRREERAMSEMTAAALRNQLGASSDSLDSAKRALERRNAELERFAEVAAHDLKTPIAGMAHHISVLREDHADALPEDARNRLHRVSELITRLSTLLSELHAYTRLRADDPATLDRIGLSDVVADACSSLRRLLRDKAVTLEIDPHLPEMTGNAEQLETMFRCLIDNAVRHNPGPDRKVEIGFLEEVVLDDRHLRDAVFVRDNGPGFTKTARGDPFDIFSRPNASSGHDGTGGTGLAFIRKIVHEHDGDIALETSPGGGTCFYLYFGKGRMHLRTPGGGRSTQWNSRVEAEAS